jgi:hypothetical protein
MLTLYPGLMANMDDGHLIRSLECEPAIMRTPVEFELMARCERLADELVEARRLIELADEFSFSAEDLRPVLEAHPGNFVCYAKMLAMLNDAEIESVEELEKVIQLWKEPTPCA